VNYIKSSVFIILFALLFGLSVQKALAVVIGDVNGSGKVDIIDIGIIIDNYAGNPIVNRSADLNLDGRVDIIDIGIAIDNYGKSTPDATPLASANPLSRIRAFPGAEGFGAYAKGGRGGNIFKITTLNDSGPGSLRNCIDASGPRFCIFEISGTINLLTQLDIINPYITIAGESAPSPGITLKNYTLSVKSHDAIIRHLRIRVGDETRGDKDAIKFNSAGTYNVIADHISASWAIDENVSTWNEGVRDITISNSIVSEALHNSINSQGPHSKGVFIGDLTKNISVINILAAHNDDRNFLVKGGGSVESINNLYYNWQEPDATEIGGGGIATVIGNVYIKGPNTFAGAKGISKNSVATLYAEDILSVGITGVSATGNVSAKPVWSGLTSPERAVSLESYLLSAAGARPKDRDVVDMRIVNEVRTRTGKVIDSQREVGGWPVLPVNTRTFPVPANPNADNDNDGYTNLEEILHLHAETLTN
jgi:hypothetical protein